MKQDILILVNSFISCSKNLYFKTQLINTGHRTQNTDTEHRTQTHVKNVLDRLDVMFTLEDEFAKATLFLHGLLSKNLISRIVLN